MKNFVSSVLAWDNRSKSNSILAIFFRENAQLTAIQFWLVSDIKFNELEFRKPEILGSKIKVKPPFILLEKREEDLFNAKYAREGFNST